MKVKQRHVGAQRRCAPTWVDTPLTTDRFDDSFRLLPLRGDSARSWMVTRDEIEARNYDLKAVNPNAKADEDLRKPEELLDLIEAKGKEVAIALARLRNQQ